jgi:hypothetical protein
LRRRNVDIIGRRQVAVVATAQETIAIGHHFQHAFATYYGIGFYTKYVFVFLFVLVLVLVLAVFALWAFLRFGCRCVVGLYTFVLLLWLLLGLLFLLRVRPFV